MEIKDHNHDHHDQDCHCNHEHHDQDCHCNHEHHDQDCECNHDQDCECNHDHDHNQHDHSHHCNHDHNHEGIESHTHENAIVVSGSRDIQGSLELIKEKLVKELELLSEWVEEQGGIIGHIKAYLDGGGLGYMLSNTSGTVECKEMQSSNVHVNIASIVFQIDIKEMECKIASIFDKL